MKRLLIALCIGLLFVGGCSSNSDKDDKKTQDSTNKKDVDMQKTLQEILNDTAYNLPGMMEVDDTILKDIYGLQPEDVEQYAIAFPMMNVHASEIIMIKAKAGKEEIVQKALDARMQTLEDTWATYLPDQYELVKKHQTITKDQVFVIIVAEKADEIKTKLEAAL